MAKCTFNIALGVTSTPVLDGDRLYVQLIHGAGLISAVKTGWKFELISQNQLEEISASLAVSGGGICSRTMHALYAIGAR